MSFGALARGGLGLPVAPLLIYADLAARTKRIKFSPLGLVLPSWDPIRAAEELAVLDHLTKGRIYAGFARGYQDRWVNVLGQQYHVTGAPMVGSSIDNHNRKVYEETVKVIKKAWTEEAWDYDGEYYKVPFPYKEGIRRWPVDGRPDAQGQVRAGGHGGSGQARDRGGASSSPLLGSGGLTRPCSVDRRRGHRRPTGPAGSDRPRDRCRPSCWWGRRSGAARRPRSSGRFR